MKDCSICISIVTNLMQFSVVWFLRNSRQEGREVFKSFFLWHWLAFFLFAIRRPNSAVTMMVQDHTHLGQKTSLWSEWGMRNSRLPLLEERPILLVMVSPWEYNGSCCSLLVRLASPETALLYPWGMGGMRLMNAITACCKLCELTLEISAQWLLQLFGLLKKLDS